MARTRWRERPVTIRAAVVAGVFGLLAATVAVGGTLLTREDAPPGPAAAVHFSVDYRPDPKTWVVPEPAAGLAPPPPDNGRCDSDERIGWVRRIGGIQAKQNHVAVHLSTNAAASVTVQDVLVDAVPVDAPPGPRTNVALCTGGDVPAEARRLEIDLDRSPARVVYVDERGAQRDRFTFQLKPHDTSLLLLTATTTTRHHRWSARLRVVVNGGERQEWRIGDGDRAFEVTPVAKGPLHEWSGTRWVPSPFAP